MGLFIYVMGRIPDGSIVTDGTDIGIVVGITDIKSVGECYVVYDPQRNVYHWIEADYLDILLFDGELAIIENGDTEGYCS